MAGKWCNTLKRLLSALLITALLAAVAVGETAQAQQGILSDVQQSVTFVYSDRLIFALEATAPATLTAVHLTLAVDNRDSPYVATPPLIAGRTVAVIHSVPVKELALPPFAALTYYWELTDENGRQYRTDPQRVRYEDTSVPWVWVTSEQGNIVVHSDGRDPALSNMALEMAHNARTQINHMLGTSYGSAPHEVLHLYVYPELAPLASSLRLHGRRVQDWVVAYAIPEQGVALIAAASGPDQVADLQRNISHEVAHIVLAAVLGTPYEGIPAWFNEGLALMTAPEPDPVLESTLALAIREGRTFPLEILCAPTFGSLSPQEAALAYAQSESVMRYVVNRFGTSQVRALLAAYASGLSCGSAAEQALGVSLTALETQWHNDLARAVARTPRESLSLLPWLIVWGVSAMLALLFIAPQPQRATGPLRRESGAALNPPPTAE